MKKLVILTIFITSSNCRLGISQWADPINVETNGFACEKYKNVFLIAGQDLYKTSETDNSLNILYTDTTQFTGLSVISDSVIIIVGINGIAKKTLNGGLNWISINPGTSEDLTDCYFFDKNIGFIIGNNSYIKKTINGGMTWEDVTIGFQYYLEDLVFTNDSIGFIGCGGNYMGEPIGWSWDFGHIFKTKDKGSTWAQKLYTKTIVSSINFPSKKIGYAVTVTGDAYKTIDYGENWINIISSDTNSYGFRSVKFLNDTIGFISGMDWQPDLTNALILMTIDGGTTWIVDYYEYLMGDYIMDISFNGNKGLAITSRYIIPYSSITNYVNNNLNDDFIIYPNPTNNILYFSNINITHPYILSIYNYLGKVIIEKEVTKLDGNTLDISNFEKGLYILTIQNENFSFSKKIIKN